MSKKINTYPNIEERNEYFVEGTKDIVKALAQLEIDYPEIKGFYGVEDCEIVPMAKCLDCETYWVDVDGICGDCCEPRLSKRTKDVLYFHK